MKVSEGKLGQTSRVLAKARLAPAKKVAVEEGTHSLKFPIISFVSGGLCYCFSGSIPVGVFPFFT
jgi:hypothetical protein